MAQPILPGTLPSPKVARDEFVRAWKEVRQRRADVEEFKGAVATRKEISAAITLEWESAADAFAAENSPGTLEALLTARRRLEDAGASLKGAVQAHLQAGVALAAARRLLDAADRALQDVAAGVRTN
jgi:hypothetical protein